jgi:hypothetical protein
MINEQWKTYGSYKVSNMGRCKRPSGEITLGWDRNGYKGINIQGTKFYVHRLVAELFCDGWFEGALVDHIDRDQQNNTYTNLRWVNKSQNVLNSKVRNTQTRVTGATVTAMLRLSQEFDLNNTEIAYVLSLDRRHVSRILMGRRQNKVTGIIREEI